MRLSESEKSRIFKLYYPKIDKLLLEFLAPQGLLQTIRTPIEKLQILPCNKAECTSFIWLNGEGGTFKYRVEVEAKGIKSAVKYKNFKKEGSGYALDVQADNTIISGIVSTVVPESKTERIETIVKNEGYIYLCRNSPYVQTKILDSNNKLIRNWTKHTYSQQKQKYCVYFDKLTPGKYIIMSQYQNKEDTYSNLSSVLKIYLDRNLMNLMQKSLILNNGEKGTVKLEKEGVNINFYYSA